MPQQQHFQPMQRVQMLYFGMEQVLLVEPQAELPKVKGSDDAKTAQWIPLGELNPQTMFEDHYFIIEDMLGAT